MATEIEMGTADHTGTPSSKGPEHEERREEGREESGRVHYRLTGR